MADLHVHSSASDGCDAPRRVIERAAALGIAVISLTDHDTVAGLAEGRTEAARRGVTFIDGIELSAMHEGRLIHLLGHFIGPDYSPLLAQTARYGNLRKDRMDKMIAKLCALGIAIDAADFYARYGERNVGRGQLSSYLMEKKFFPTKEGVFASVLGPEGPAYVSFDMLTPEAAIRLIAEAGGAATFAHPNLSGADDLIPAMVEAGLAGIETGHPSQVESSRAHYRAIALRHDLVEMGGSDCHGAVPGPERLGEHCLPLGRVEALRARAGVSA
ncbi:MAG: PHP domain-containing protein [bacterium]|nr:PHP domain-containing protein [bacterium]